MPRQSQSQLKLERPPSQATDGVCGSIEMADPEFLLDRGADGVVSTDYKGIGLPSRR